MVDSASCPDQSGELLDSVAGFSALGRSVPKDLVDSSFPFFIFLHLIYF